MIAEVILHEIYFAVIFHAWNRTTEWLQRYVEKEGG